MKKSSVILCVVCILVVLAFVPLTSRFIFGINERASLEEIGQVKYLEFNNGLKPEMALAIQMSKSPTIVSYMENPYDENLEALAMEEVKSYQDSFASHITFMINDIDLKYYSNNEELYVLDKSDPSSVWYTSTMQSSKVFDYNVDYSIGLKKTYLWVNGIVRNSSGKALGLIGTGIPLSDYVDSMYVNLDKNVEMYLFNAKKEITGSTDLSYLENKTNIEEVLPELAKFDITPNSKTTFSTFKNVYTVIPLPDVNWFIIIKNSFSLKKFVMNMIIPVLIVIVVVFIVLAIGIFRSTIKPLRSLSIEVERLASGDADLSKRLDMEMARRSLKLIKRLGNGFNSLLEKLQTTISTVKSSKESLVENGENLNSCSENASSSISQIISNINNLGSVITQQSDSVGETTGAINQISSNVDSLEQFIDTQSSYVSEASSAVEEMIGNISSVTMNTGKLEAEFGNLESNTAKGIEKQDDVNSRVAEIQTQSQMLQEANLVISSIAEQTNLLAMNAAIEAAHAGEAGKGFSVVADEIRKLSETSSAQSKTIGEQLKTIQDSIGNIVQVSAESKDAFELVTEGIKKTNSLVQEITIAMREQDEGSKQVSGALSMLNNATNDVKTASKEMSLAKDSLLNEMGNLEDSSRNIKTGMDEMFIGAKKIEETGSSLKLLSDSIQESISSISHQIDSFRC